MALDNTILVERLWKEKKKKKQADLTRKRNNNEEKVKSYHVPIAE